MDAQSIIQSLDLTAHPEGGYFRETYRSADTLAGSALPDRYKGSRSVSTSIYFLLPVDQHSAFHRLATDELWYYNLGSAVTVFMIHPDGSYEETTLGPDLSAGHVMQAVIPAGTWFGAKVSDASGFVLVSCSVAPGFDFEDFELATRPSLLKSYPQHADIITQLTPEP